jgi:hypothetical protein
MYMPIPPICPSSLYNCCKTGDFVNGCRNRALTKRQKRGNKRRAKIGLLPINRDYNINQYAPPATTE